MKYNFFITLIAILFTSNIATGQAEIYLAFGSNLPVSDSLIIERQDGQKIRLTWPYKKNIKKNILWEGLINDFQSDFTKVYDNIPEYKFYSITYLRKQNLVVDEVRGKETYTVNENEGLDYVKSNSCTLQDEQLKITIEFNNKDELLDPSLKMEIESAIEMVKNKFYISAVSPDRHYYSVNSSSILPNPKSQIKFFVPLGARLGVLKNEPYVELRPGLGVVINKRNYAAINWNIFTQFNELVNETNFDHYVGFTLGSIDAGFGSEFSFKVSDGITANESIFLKAGINYRTRSGIQIGAEYFLNEADETTDINQEVLFGFNIGFGF